MNVSADGLPVRGVCKVSIIVDRKRLLRRIFEIAWREKESVGACSLQVSQECFECLFMLRRRGVHMLRQAVGDICNIGSFAVRDVSNFA